MQNLKSNPEKDFARPPSLPKFLFPGGQAIFWLSLNQSPYL